MFLVVSEFASRSRAKASGEFHRYTTRFYRNPTSLNPHMPSHTTNPC